MPKATTPTQFDLLLFDLDGTLIETGGEIADAVNDTLQEQGQAALAQQQVCDWIGHGTRELLVQALAHVQHESTDVVRNSPELPQTLHRFDAHYQRRCGTRSQLYPHVREVLHALRVRGVRMAVVTNKDGRYTRALLREHHLSPLFEVVVSGDSLPSKKPDPAGIRGCMDVFKVTAEKTLFVGDSSIDVATARAAGVTVWALPYGYNMGRPIQDSAPDRVIQNFSALLSIVASARA